jgi:hypothetical protein
LLVEALVRRMGETPEQRLRWVVDFTGLDLDSRKMGEIEAKGDDLRMIAAFSAPHGVLRTMKTAPVPLGVLKNYQHRIEQGLREVLGTDARWALSGRPVLERREGGFRLVVDGQGDEMAGILSAVAQLVVEVGEHLRTCADPKCGRPFVAVKRQAYCSVQHSQRVRNQKRIERERI